MAIGDRNDPNETEKYINQQTITRKNLRPNQRKVGKYNKKKGGGGVGVIQQPDLGGK